MELILIIVFCFFYFRLKNHISSLHDLIESFGRRVGYQIERLNRLENHLRKIAKRVRTRKKAARKKEAAGEKPAAVVSKVMDSGPKGQEAPPGIPEKPAEGAEKTEPEILLPPIPKEIPSDLPDYAANGMVRDKPSMPDAEKPGEPSKEKTMPWQGKPLEAEPAASGADDDGPPPFDWMRKWEQFKENVDWEQFAGTKLFAWLAGIALFVGAGFFVKYSIDKDLISPMLRLVIGAVAGLGLIIASSRFDRQRYDIMRQTFAAGGIGVLYSVFFAATLYYEFLPKSIGFACLTAVSATAFVLAVFHEGISISILGGIGAYSTPILVTTGEGSLITLALYLGVVNFGFYQVMKRLEADGLQLFATTGTLISLALATVFSSPHPEGFEIAVSWAGNLVLFSFFFDMIGAEPRKKRSDSWAGNILYFSLLVVAFLLTLDQPGSSPMFMLTIGTIGAVTLALRNRGWYQRVVPFSVLAFIVAIFWTLWRIDRAEVPWSYVLFLLYGVAGGAGPILLIRKYGPDESFASWFKTFPVAIAGISFIAVYQNPHLSFWFWPMTLGLQVLGIIISLIFGSIIQLGLLSLFLVIGALIWLTHADPIAFSMGFYAFLLGAGALLCLVIFYVLSRLPDWIESLRLEKRNSSPHQELPLLTEWMVASPLIGAFVLLAASFLQIQPLNPHPGMATLVCFLAIALTLSKHLDFQHIAIVSLFSAPFSQAFWMLRPEETLEVHFSSLVWAGAFFGAALVLPFLLFGSYEKWNKIWMSWAIFEALQGVFLIFAADHIWNREISGWVPMVLVVLKLPVVARLLKQLEGMPQRNAIIACLGGVLLFYFSAVPILLLEKGWLGLTLVFEATALLWLNRRVEHPGLRWVSSIMAPIGMFMLLTNITKMKGPGSIVIFNPAVMATIACVCALFYAVRLSSYPEPKLGTFSNLPDYFLWLAVGTGFYLVNLIIADVFGGTWPMESAATTWNGLKFLPEGNLLQAISYMFCWALFGAFLWKSRNIPSLMRLAGMLLLVISTFWLIFFPITYSLEIGNMAPLFNFGFLAYLPIMLILLYLFLKEPYGEDSFSVKNLFLAMFLIVGFLSLKVIKATILQPGLPFDIFQAKTARMAVGSAAGWLLYGLAMLLWPKRLDRPFRIAGLVLIILGLIRTMLFPFKYSEEFGAMQPLFNSPSLLFLLSIAMLMYLTIRKPDEKWPFQALEPGPFWGWISAVMVFYVLNIEIASVFGVEDRAFSLLTRGSLSHQLAYSLGWLLYSICFLVIGINWKIVKVRQASLILIVFTSFKIFFKDLWSLGQLYRVASFIGLSAVLMLVSYLYQRFIVREKEQKNEK